MIYPPGFNWDANLKAVVGTDLCMHAHVGFMAKGQIQRSLCPHGCVIEYKSSAVLSPSKPGHHGWVVGDEPALI